MTRRVALAVGIASLLFASTASAAGAATPTVRLHSALLPLDNAARVGAVDGGKRMTIGLGLADRDPAGRAALVGALYDPASPSYHRFLTPAEYQARFGPAASQVALAKSWLASGGLDVGHVSSAGDYLAASGTVDQIQALLGTQLNTYVAKGVQFIANATAPLVPAGLDITGVLGLNTLSSARTFGSSATQIPATLHAKDLWKIYDLPSDHTGKGQSIAIMMMGRADTVTRDLSSYEDKEGLPHVKVDVVPAVANGNYSDDSGHGEWILDTQSATGMAPDVDRVVMYQAQSLTDVDQEAAFSTWVSDPNGPRQANASFGECETTPLNQLLEKVIPDPLNVSTHPSPGIGTNLPNALEPVAEQTLQQAVMQGKTLFASTGDTGSSCPAVVLGPVGAGNGLLNQVVPLVNYPAASPYAVAVGGTVLYPDGAKRSLEYAWPFTGGGQSFFLGAPSYQSASTGAGRPCLSGYDGSTALTGKPCRGIPDVAALSGDIATSAFAIVDDGKDSASGGTSLSSPLWAGIWARVQSASPNGAAGNGFANPALYHAAETTPNDFYDITVGANGVYLAGKGWDYVSGWGVPNGTALTRDVTAAVKAGTSGQTADPPKVSASKSASCAPKVTLKTAGVQIHARTLSIRGTASDKQCGGRIKALVISVQRAEKGQKCRFVNPSGRLGPAVKCNKLVLLPVKAGSTFSIKRKVTLPKGRYTVLVRATNSGGNTSKARRAVRTLTRG